MLTAPGFDFPGVCSWFLALQWRPPRLCRVPTSSTTPLPVFCISTTCWPATGSSFTRARRRSKGSPTSAGSWFLLPLATAIGPLWAAKLLGCALLIVAIAMVMRLGQTLAAPASAAGRRHRPNGQPQHFRGSLDSRQLPLRSFGLTIVPAALLATSFEFVYFSLAGMETALLAVILLGMALVASRRPGSMALPILAPPVSWSTRKRRWSIRFTWRSPGRRQPSRDSPQRDGTERRRTLSACRPGGIRGPYRRRDGGAPGLLPRLGAQHFSRETERRRPGGRQRYALLMGENRNIAFPDHRMAGNRRAGDGLSEAAAWVGPDRRHAAGNLHRGDHLCRLRTRRLDRFAPLLRSLPARGAHSALGRPADRGRVSAASGPVPVCAGGEPGRCCWPRPSFTVARSWRPWTSFRATSWRAASW